jgi:putative membrane protein
MKRVLALILSAPLSALAADTNPDQAFFANAAQGGLAEVEDGKLAAEQGNSQAVKNFAAMMVKDHTAANDKLQRIAAAEMVELPTAPSVTQTGTHKELKSLSGDEFDKSYIEGQLKAHEETVLLFEKEISTGQDREAKAFASSTLPIVQGHLKMIRGIAAKAGVDLNK